MYLRHSHRDIAPQTMRYFPDFFSFAALLPLPYRHGKFRTSSSIRSSETSSRCFVKEGVLKNFVNFSWSLFLIKLQAGRLATLLKIDTNTGVFL